MKSKNFLILLCILGITMLFASSCTSWVPKEIEITYQVTATNLDRDLEIYYANEYNGKDVIHDTATLFWEKTYTVVSDTVNQRWYELYVFCDESDPVTTQLITVRIIEDGVIVAERSTGGTAYIGFGETIIDALLPSENRFIEEEKR